MSFLLFALTTQGTTGNLLSTWESMNQTVILGHVSVLTLTGSAMAMGVNVQEIQG